MAASASPRTVCWKRKSNGVAASSAIPRDSSPGKLEAELRAASLPVARVVGADPQDLVFVENATTGLNAVLRCFPFRPGDEILITSLVYPAIRKAARFAAEQSGAQVIEVPIPLPLVTSGDILTAVSSRLGKRTRLAIFDHIASHSALVLPVAELTRLAQEAGAQVLIDGAHVPGMLALDVSALGADWYVGNLHKWFFAPRSCGFLWAAPAVQADLHPLAISHGYGTGFRPEFEWTGTRDVTASLSAPAGIAFHGRLGGSALMGRNRVLAREGAALLARFWGSPLGGPPEFLRGNGDRAAALDRGLQCRPRRSDNPRAFRASPYRSRGGCAGGSVMGTDCGAGL